VLQIYLEKEVLAGMAGFKAGVSVNAMRNSKIMNKAFGKGGSLEN
jgi:hypothetical protein